jgi:chromate transporter
MSSIPAGTPSRIGADGRQWPTFRAALGVWSRIALLSFGGPAGQIAVMHRILVDEKRWLGEGRFLHALNFCMLLPGPEAQQLTVYIGWLMHRTKGGIVAGLLFVLPGAVAIMALSLIYAVYGNIGAVAALFFGLKAAVLAIVLQALVRIAGKTLKNMSLFILAGASFVAIFLFDMPFPLIILAAALIGFVGGRAGWTAFQAHGDQEEGSRSRQAEANTILGHEQNEDMPKSGMSLRTIIALLCLWIGPTVFLFLWLGPESIFSDIALFFSKMAVVTFGGAYAVLAYVAQAAVETYGWLQPGEMLDGLGMAETTPGPLIMVTQFVGFMGAFRDPGMLTPILAGILGGLLTTWVTFAPCFLWIFAGAPYIERLRHNKALSAALKAITAAVVGVILNLAVWFTLHVVFTKLEVVDWGPVRLLSIPEIASLDLAALVLTVVALIAVFRYSINILLLIAGAGIAGYVLHLIGMIG